MSHTVFRLLNSREVNAILDATIVFYNVILGAGAKKIPKLICRVSKSTYSLKILNKLLCLFFRKRIIFGGCSASKSLRT